MAVVNEHPLRFCLSVALSINSLVFLKGCVLIRSNQLIFKVNPDLMFSPARDGRICDLEVCRNFRVASTVERHFARRENRAF